MEASKNDHLIDTTSVNRNEFRFSSSPSSLKANCTNLETFDFESFFAESHSDISIPAVYTVLQNIDYTADERTFIVGANYIRPFASRVLVSSEHPEHPEVTGRTILEASSDSCSSSRDLPISTDLFCPATYMISQKTNETVRKCTQPYHLEDDCRKAKQLESPGQAPADASRNVGAPCRQSNQPKLRFKTVAESTRTLNITTFDPSLFYKPLARTPQSWRPPGAIDTLFDYNAQGELDPGHTFSREQLSDYLTYHPLHTFYDPSPSTKHSGLSLWVQNTPADSRNRYPTNLSSKCRFADCPAPNRTIRNGQFRVAFDEQSIFCEPLDPFHNAGYVHLFCLEKNFDFPRMCKRFNVQGDDRVFPEGRNKMAITRDHPPMFEIVNDFIKASVPWGGERPENWYEHSLSLALTRYHLQHQSRLRQRIREARDGNSLDRHLNNLDVMAEIGKGISERKAREKRRPRH